MNNLTPDKKITTKSLPSSKNEHLSELSIAEKNSKFTRLIWRTHNDFHQHMFWEICLVLNGKGKHSFLDHTADMYAGTMWLLRPNDIHKIEPLPSEPSRTSSYAHRDIYIEENTMRRILNAFEDNLYEKLLNADKPLFAHIPLPELTNIESMINYYSLNESNFEFMHSVLTSHIIALAFEQNNYIIKNDKPEWLNLLLANLNSIDFLTLPMQKIISSIGYSQEHVCREFKKHMNTTLSRYIQKMKCMYSLSLLTDKSIPIVDIANKLYFPDESNFITTFKKIYNMTPGEWRKHLKNK